MRMSIEAQSSASVPPAPELMSTIAPRRSSSRRSMLRNSSASIFEIVRVYCSSSSCSVTTPSLTKSGISCRSSTSLTHCIVLVDPALDAGHAAQLFARLVRIVPENREPESSPPRSGGLFYAVRCQRNLPNATWRLIASLICSTNTIVKCFTLTKIANFFRKPA